jgi:hypothetical protein
MFQQAMFQQATAQPIYYAIMPALVRLADIAHEIPSNQPGPLLWP